MVFVSSSYADGYPNLVSFVNNELTRIPQKTAVYNAFLKYAEYGSWAGRWVFFSVTDPMIQIEDLNTHSEEDEYIFAKYKTPTPRYIFIDVAWAKRFETDYQSPNLSAKAKLLMEACILHEMCHRGDWADGKEQANEPGEAFEKAAYGAVQGRYW